ncbi:hypothetical protein K0I73_13365 [Shewanella mesophila]|uniref:hypothetical protein n=1 Tax=Shewanella mesophila TaxID=2864208 RepID=UPI001C65A3B6|nr:hypothetical protein [Shewanella mesophila]QYJ85194.1 hypothetical protein K0I73_13365 [Shewanella mesophila]
MSGILAMNGSLTMRWVTRVLQINKKREMIRYQPSTCTDQGASMSFSRREYL